MRFKHVLAGLDIAFENYTFVDFRSGKGRALLPASEFPFRRILGLEFSPELHRTAEENIRRYNSATQKCRDIQSLNVDFADFALPPEASVLFFFHPCRISECCQGSWLVLVARCSHTPARCTSHTSPQRQSKSNCSLPPASWRRYSTTRSSGFAFIEGDCRSWTKRGHFYCGMTKHGYRVDFCEPYRQTLNSPVQRIRADTMSPASPSQARRRPTQEPFALCPQTASPTRSIRRWRR
jgi:hypothetical protein